MHPTHNLSGDLMTLAELQAGALSCEQLLSLGVTRTILRRMATRGTLTPLTRGVYTLGPPTWHSRAWAGLLIGGERAVLGYAAAGALWGLVAQPDVIDVYTGDSLPRPREGYRFHRGIRLCRGAPAHTRAEDTVLDLCRELDVGDITTLLAEAFFRRITTPKRLERRLESLPKLPNRALVLELVTEVGGGVMSPLELRYHRDVERAHGLPTASRQAATRGGCADAFYEEYGVIVELDGAGFHSGRRIPDDLWRDNENTGADLITLRYAPKHVFVEPCAVALQVGEQLTDRGWRGVLKACRRCWRVRSA